MGDEHQVTLPLGPGAGGPLVPGFRLTVVEGPRPGHHWDSPADRCSIGSHPSNDMSFDEPTVPRFHCEVRADAQRVRVRDLGSRNGTPLDGGKVAAAAAAAGMDRVYLYKLLRPHGLKPER
jgi:pSer/pThr/pTyr-binding forkhead associated (FHA) protein